MEKAFEIILEALWVELEKQGFSEAKKYSDDRGPAYMFSTEEVCYGVLYNEEKKAFVLQSNAFKADGSFANPAKEVPEDTKPAEPVPTGDSALIFAVVALISVLGIATVAKRREN